MLVFLAPISFRLIRLSRLCGSRLQSIMSCELVAFESTTEREVPLFFFYHGHVMMLMRRGKTDVMKKGARGARALLEQGKWIVRKVEAITLCS